MSYNRDPFKKNQFRREDGSLDFSDFWPNKKRLQQEDDLDPEEASNAELARSLVTIVNHMGQPEKKREEPQPKKVKVIRRNQQNYLTNDDKNACLVLGSYRIDLKNFILKPRPVQSYNWEDVVHSPVNLRDISERLEKGIISDYLSRQGLGVLGPYSLFLERGIIKIQDKTKGLRNLRLDNIYATHIQTSPRINSRDIDLTMIHFFNPSDHGKVMYQLHNPETKDIIKIGLFYRAGNSFRIYEVLR